MADYNYVKETFEIETITDAIESLQKRILAFSDKIDTEDVTKLCNIIDDAKETAGCIYDHLSSLNTEKNRETYLNGINKKYAAKKVADLFKHTNVIDMTTLKVKGITSEDLVAFQEYYNVRLHESGWGTWRWLGIHDLQGNNLSFDEIHEKLGINTNEEKPFLLHPRKKKRCRNMTISVMLLQMEHSFLLILVRMKQKLGQLLKQAALKTVSMTGSARP